MDKPDTSLPPEEFWETIYQAGPQRSGGHPTLALERFVSNRPPGRALDLGCARGDDAVWLARRGWDVLGVDIAPTALVIAAENAERNGVVDRIRFEAHDLAQSFPEGAFDLVSAMFLQTPLEFPRVSVINRAARSVLAGGLLLLATHQRVAPGSWSDPDTVLPDAAEHLAQLDIDSRQWREVFVGAIDREKKMPSGELAPVTDAVIALERI